MKTRQLQMRFLSSKVQASVFSLFMIMVLFSSCKRDGNAENKPTVENSPKTQALLMIQPVDLDVVDQNKISGEYIKKDKVVVPSNLSAQNKWMMFEGPVLENDLVAYRFYADSRNRCDVYGKIVKDLVMDTVSWDYHNIMDWGSDILKVGNSLGLGSPAIWYQDSLYTLSEYEEKTIEVLESGAAKSIVRTTFKNLNVDGNTLNIVQDWSLEAGKPWSEIHLKVIGGELPMSMSFATGIVKHLPEIIQGESGDFFYAMNWGVQSFHDQYMGMAILANKQYQPIHVDDELSHAYAFEQGRKEVRYRLLSAWEKDNNAVNDVDGFKNLVEGATL